jgi:hypothetical protein
MGMGTALVMGGLNICRPPDPARWASAARMASIHPALVIAVAPASA